ncbi:hypothetical protein Tco_0164772 [Tanacetum coccineum]
MFLKYSTGLIPPKKSRGKGSQGKKTADVSQESIDVSDESEPEPAKKKTGSRSIRGVVIQDTPSAPNPKPATSKLKLKGTGGSSEGTSRQPGVLEESIVVSTTSSEGTGTKPGVPDEEKVISKENVILEWGSEQESKHSEDSQLNSDEEEKKDNDSDADDEDEDDDHVSDSQDTDDEDVEIESDEDEIYKYKIQVHKDVDVEMKEAKTVECENKEKVEMTYATKADVEKTTKEKGDAELARNAMASNYQVNESTEFPLLSSSLSLSSGFVTPTILIVQQRTTPIHTPPITTKAPTISIVVPEFDALTAIQLRVAKLEKDVSELKKIDHSVEALALLRSQVLTVLEHYLGSKIALESSKIQSPTVDPEQESEKSASEIRKKILGVKSVNVKKLHGYGHLEEILVKRADRQLYNFKEGDFVDLHLNDIKDMLLLVVQHKLFHLNHSDIVDFIVALCMTLKIVRDELHHRVLDFHLGYNDEMSRRKWTAIDKKRSELMVELIDRQMRERRISRNLERLVGAQELEMDYKLMTHIV